MKKTLAIAALMITALNSSAHALGGSNIDKCGPEVELSLEGSNGRERGWGYGAGSYGSSGGNTYDNQNTNEYSVGITLSWNLGFKEKCERNNSYTLTKNRNLADQEKIEVLTQKIQICKDFNHLTAPGSIKDFCGDLLGVEVPETATAVPTYPTFN